MRMKIEKADFSIELFNRNCICNKGIKCHSDEDKGLVIAIERERRGHTQVFSSPFL